MHHVLRRTAIREQPRIYELLHLTVTTPVLQIRALLTHLMVGAASAAFEVWIREKARQDITDLLDEALATARRALAEPRPAAPSLAQRPYTWNSQALPLMPVGDEPSKRSRT